MSEARPRPRGRSRDASAIKASRKAVGGADATADRSARSSDASPRSERAGVGPVPAEPSPVLPPARRAGSRDASRRASGPAEKTQPRKSRSRDGSVAPARNRVRAPQRAGFICPPCGRFVPTEIDGVVLRTPTGSPPRFCSPGCRQAAYRRRQAGVGEDVALQLRGGRDRSLGERKATGDA